MIMDTSSSYFMGLTLGFLIIFVGSTSSQNVVCPFINLYQFGGGATDIGNSIHVHPNLNLLIPSAHPPYGKTYPTYPTGRWSDGHTIMDYAATSLGFPIITPYLAHNTSTSNGVIFSVARSPVLGADFFKARNITIEPFAISLVEQLNLFKTHLNDSCNGSKGCISHSVANALILLEDIESNDLGYALTQGILINKVQKYVPQIIKTHINVARELIAMGATRLIIPGSNMIGCYPYMLTELHSNDSNAYDEHGCLRRVNDLIKIKNKNLQQAIVNLKREFPTVSIHYSDYSDGFLQYLNWTLSRPSGKNTLKSCCGIGGQYNFDSNKICGSEGVSVCTDPDIYIFWDGFHLTQEAHLNIKNNVVPQALTKLKCSSSG